MLITKKIQYFFNLENNLIESESYLVNSYITISQLKTNNTELKTDIIKLNNSNIELDNINIEIIAENNKLKDKNLYLMQCISNLKINNNMLYNENIKLSKNIKDILNLL